MVNKDTVFANYQVGVQRTAPRLRRAALAAAAIGHLDGRAAVVSAPRCRAAPRAADGSVAFNALRCAAAAAAQSITSKTFAVSLLVEFLGESRQQLRAPQQRRSIQTNADVAAVAARIARSARAGGRAAAPETRGQPWLSCTVATDRTASACCRPGACTHVQHTAGSKTAAAAAHRCCRRRLVSGVMIFAFLGTTVDDKVWLCC